MITYINISKGSYLVFRNFSFTVHLLVFSILTAANNDAAS